MSVTLWLIFWVCNTVFCYWVVCGGGASYFEGWRSFFIVDWLFAYRWTTEQISLYTLLCWVGHTLLFFVGLFAPATRFVFW
jgi:hypothetical protein